MRIIAGIYGGRRLVAPKHERTRPTPDRVREALFAILGDIEGDRVLDAFAGSGALGLEALSRGAASATLVDRAPSAITAIRRNLDTLSIQTGAEVLRGDIQRLLTHGRISGPFDLVFLDPPYRAKLYSPTLRALDSARVLSEAARIVCEYDDEAPTLPERWRINTERRYGDVSVLIAELLQE